MIGDDTPPDGSQELPERLISADVSADDLEQRRMLAAVRRGLFGKSTALVTIGRYELGEILGSGGMGVVYQAHDPVLRRDAAVKLLRHGFVDAERQARLVREARAMARLQHPNVLTVFEVGEAEGRAFIAMELARGGSLRSWLGAARRPWPQIVGRFVQAGRGLAAAHEAGLIHRDFKPENVFIHDDGSVQVGDFGLVIPDRAADLRARTAPGVAVDELRSSPLTREGAVVGTPAYMAPEQRAGDQVDARADQFSFCIALMEALVGERPADTWHFGQVEHRRATTRLGALPRWLRAPISRGLRPNPIERYPTMRALLRDLERGLLRRRVRPWIAAAALAAGLGVAALVTLREAPEAACEAAGEPVFARWNPGARALLARGLARSGDAGAAASWRRVVDAFDAWARRWGELRREGCAAARSGGASAGLRRRQDRCLDRRRLDFEALIAALTADAPVSAARAEGALRGLRGLDPCADAEALLAGAAAKDVLKDMSQRTGLKGQQEGVDDLTGALARARAALAVDEAAAAEALAEATRAEARARGDRAGEAEASLLVGAALHRRGDDAAAEAALVSAHDLAYAAAAEEIAAEAAALLIEVVGAVRERRSEALMWARQAEVAGRRAGVGPAWTRSIGASITDLACALVDDGHGDQVARILGHAPARDGCPVADDVGASGR